MKKITPHHHLTPKGGRVASRKLVRPSKKITSTTKPSGMDLGVTPVFMRRTRPKGAGA